MVALGFAAGAGAVLLRRAPGAPPVPRPRLDAPAELAVWPWPHAMRETPHPGVTHWLDRSSADGTVVELFDFDFLANRRLRLGLYDQDEDDAVPFDNNADTWALGVGQATRRLNQGGRGRIVAAWNGLFFDSGARPAHHVAPVVLAGRFHYNLPNPRWTFGVHYENGRSGLKLCFRPRREEMIREFTYASGGAQCLLREGRPLKLRPFPEPGEVPPKGPAAAAPDEAGYIRDVDHMRTSRTSMGWSRDSRHFYLLVVKEPDHEAGSLLSLRHGEPGTGGWTLADLQRFWQAQGAWSAVNIDGGDVTQLCAICRDGRYEMVPPRWSDGAMRLTFPPDFPIAPAGGTMMYFYISDTK
jgi:hypothetical protein